VELDRALEFAVVAAWEEVVKPGDISSVHVEYEKQPGCPLASLSVWTIRNRGYGTLVCRYSVAPPGSVSSPSEATGVCFANSYQSELLAECLDFIVRNQGKFTRPADRSIHGLVQIDCPSEQDRRDAATWSQTVVANFAETVWN